MIPLATPRARRGLALIVVVGILGVLAVLATAFVTMAQLERKASLQRVNAEKAYLLSRSGIEDAAARLGMGQDPEAAWNRYQGENWDGDALDALSAVEQAQQVYHVTATGTSADTDACPVQDAMRPSFSAKAGANPALRNVDGRLRGYSGMLSGDSGPQGNLYALKVRSQNGFYLNGGDPSHRSYPTDPTATTDYNTTLRRILGTLAEAIDREDGVNNGLPVGDVDGWALIDNRPPGGWVSLDQVKALALGGSQAKLDALKPYLTLAAWTDTKVIQPNARTTDDLGHPVVGKPYYAWAEIKLDHAVNPSDPTSRAPDFERINGRIVGRAPVDLAWARTRRPALIALVAGLQGIYLDENTLGPAIGTMTSAMIANAWNPADDCHTAVSAILTSTSALSTWQEWDAFCDTLWKTLPAGWTSDLRQAKRDILKANFNPNSDLNKFNPGASLWKLVDKSDLLAYSTEFSLVPAQGREVACVGRILGRNGRLLASRTLKADLARPSLLRLTTQRDFVSEDPEDPLAQPRKPGAPPDFLSQSQGAGRTWGHAINMTGTYPGTWMDGAAGRGTGLQVYPEPYVTAGPPGTPLSIRPADYDGGLQLATLDTLKDDTYGNDTATTHLMMALARFDDGWDLDQAAGGSRACVTDVSQVTTGELTRSLWDAAKPNTLYPDGAYSEKGRVPAFRDKGNAQGWHGVLSFWAKDGFLYEFIGRYHNSVNRTNYASPSATFLGEPEQVFDLQNEPWNIPFPGPHYLAGFSFSATHVNPSWNSAFTGWTVPLSPPLTGHAWQLWTVAWDSRCLKGWWDGELRLNDLAPWLSTATSDDWSVAEDLTADDASGPHRTVLGLGQQSDVVRDPLFVFNTTENTLGADATLDEFALWDFGGAAADLTKIPPVQTPPPADARNAAENLAGNRYREGRYYREATYYAPGAHGSGEAGSWVSGPITLPAGAVLRKAAWTFRRPRALPDDYAELELLDTAAGDYLLDPGALPPAASHSRSTLDPRWAPPSPGRDRQSWDLDHPLPGAFRARVVFERTTPVPSGTPLLESPVFDDLTLVYLPGGLGITAWSEGE